MTNQNEPTPGPAILEFVIRKNIASYTFERRQAMEPIRQLVFPQASPDFKSYFQQPGSLDEYYYQKVLSIDPNDPTPYAIASSAASTLHLSQFNQYQNNFLEFKTDIYQQITQINQKIDVNIQNTNEIKQTLVGFKSFFNVEVRAINISFRDRLITIFETVNQVLSVVNNIIGWLRDRTRPVPPELDPALRLVPNPVTSADLSAIRAELVRINQRLDQLPFQIVRVLAPEFSAVLGSINRVFSYLQNIIYPLLQEIQEYLENTIWGEIVSIQNYLQRTIKPLLDELTRRIPNNLIEILRNILQVVVRIELVLLPEISAAIETGFAAVAAELATVQLTLGAIEATLAAIGTLIGNGLIALSASIAGVQVAVTAVITKEIGDVSKQIEDAVEHICECVVIDTPSDCDECAASIANYLSKRFIGDSYYNWSSISQFYPTLIFLFAEVDSTAYSKRAQIKTRLNTLDNSREVAESEIERLKSLSEVYSALQYEHGIIRGNYVSESKHFKTVVFGQTHEEIVAVLRTISDVIQDKFDQGRMTFTTGVRAVSPLRKQVAIGSDEMTQIKVRNEFTVICYRVVLLSKQLDSPYIIWQRP